MPKPDCISLVIEAAEQTLNKRDAGRMIRTFAEMAEVTQARYGDGTEEALKKVNRFLKNQRTIEGLQAKRNAVLNLAKVIQVADHIESFAAGGKIRRMDAYTDFLIGEQGIKRGKDGQILSTRQAVSKQQVQLTQDYTEALDKALSNVNGKDLRKIYDSGRLSEEIFLELGHMISEVAPKVVPEKTPGPEIRESLTKRQKDINEVQTFIKSLGDKEKAYTRWKQGLYAEAEDGTRRIDEFEFKEKNNADKELRKIFGKLVKEGEEQRITGATAQGEALKATNKPVPKPPEWERRTKSYLLERGDVDPEIANVAKQIADVIYDVREQMITRHNLAGGLNDPKAGRMIHQTHNVHRITKGFHGNIEAAYANWRAKIFDRLDLEKSFDGIKDIEAELRERFGAIVSEYHGTSDPTIRVDDDGVPIDGPKKKDQPTYFIRKGSLAKRGSKEDLFVFKSPEDFWAYNQEFGSMSLNDAISSELHYYGHSTALMENMGPDPDGTFNAVMKLLQEKDKNDLVVAKEGSARKIPPRSAFEQVSGYLDNPGSATAKKINNVVKWFKWHQALSKLGGITISAVADKPQMHFTLTYHGLSQAEAFMANIKAFIPKGEDERAFISAIGVALDYRAAELNSRFSFGGGEPRTAVARKTQDAMFKWTMMHQWNDAHKGATAVALMHKFGKYAGVELDQLPKDMSKSLRMYGITDQDWRNLSSVATQASDGRVYIMPENIRKLAGDNPSVTTQREINALEMKFKVWISDIANEAVITPGARERIYARMGTKKGTAAGALVETLNYFRSFQITVTSKILGRELYGFEGELSRRFARGIGILASSAVAGYTSGAIRDMLNGKTRKPWLNEDGSPNLTVLADSIARGGALGVYSDLIFFEYDKSYRSILSTAAGPIIGTGVEGLTLAGKTVRGLMSDEIDVPEPHQYTKFLQANTPLIGLPVIKLGLDMILFNNINEMMEPGYLDEMKRGLENRTGQEYWTDILFD